MTIQERIKEFDPGDVSGNSLFVQRLLYELMEKDVLYVLQVMNSTCHECWDSSDRCRCWNDD